MTHLRRTLDLNVAGLPVDMYGRLEDVMSFKVLCFITGFSHFVFDETYQLVSQP